MPIEPTPARWAKRPGEEACLEFGIFDHLDNDGGRWALWRPLRLGGIGRGGGFAASLPSITRRRSAWPQARACSWRGDRAHKRIRLGPLVYVLPLIIRCGS